MPQVALTEQQDQFAISIGRRMVRYWASRDLSLACMKSRTEKESPMDFARRVSGEYGDSYRLVSEGITPKIRMDAARASIQQYRPHTEKRFVRMFVHDIFDQIMRNRSQEIRALMVEALPLGTPPAFFRRILFSKDGRWRKDQKPCVRRAVILDLIKRGNLKLLVAIAQDAELPWPYAVLILDNLCQDWLAHVARYADPRVADAAMKRITSHPILVRLAHQPRPLVRNAAREKLGYSPDEPRRSSSPRPRRHSRSPVSFGALR